jgi:hypothetical protein
MITKLALFLIGAALTVSAQTNLVHNWTLKSGAVFPGDYFTSGELMVVIKSHGTNCLLKISELSTNDWLYFQDRKAAQRQRQLDAEAVQLAAQGYIEVTSQLLENFPEKVNFKTVWMDCTFWRFSPYTAMGETAPDVILVLQVNDKNNDLYQYCEIFKNVSADNFATYQPNPVAQALANIKPGDKLRLFGIGHNTGAGFHQFEIQNFEMIESAADAAAVKKVKEDLENPDAFGSITGLPK